jgi:hypothetical protein
MIPTGLENLGMQISAFVHSLLTAGHRGIGQQVSAFVAKLLGGR